MRDYVAKARTAVGRSDLEGISPHRSLEVRLRHGWLIRYVWLWVLAHLRSLLLGLSLGVAPAAERVVIPSDQHQIPGQTTIYEFLGSGATASREGEAQSDLVSVAAPIKTGGPALSDDDGSWQWWFEHVERNE